MTTERPEKRGRRVPAAARSIAIIDLVTSTDERLKIPQIGARLGIPRNSTYELIDTLAEADVISVSTDGRVSPGFRLFEWGGAYAQSLDLIGEARQVASELAERLNETVHVARLIGSDVVYLVKQEGEQHVRMGSAEGRRVPAHATSVGKMLLASLEPERLDEILSGPLPRLTPNTIVDHTALRRELAEAARAGVAFETEESSPEVCCVAAPIRDHRGTVVAALSISTLATRWDSSRDDLATAAVEAAGQIARRLGAGTSA
jgi:DNA-binding IclR family transcriptional regulator